MGIFEIILIGLALGADSFAVAICKGLSMQRMDWKKAAIIATYFGTFHVGMPMLGYFLGTRFENVITNIDHWIACMLLAFIGINMIHEALKKDKEDSDENVDFKTMISLVIATSIDALAVGVTFSFLNVNINMAAGIIGTIAFLMSFVGVKIGNMFGKKYKEKAELLGGTILILMGLKILLEHLFI